MTMESFEIFGMFSGYIFFVTYAGNIEDVFRALKIYEGEGSIMSGEPTSMEGS